MSFTNLRPVTVSATVTAVDTPCRLRGWSISPQQPGQVAFRNGAAGSTIVFGIDVQASAARDVYLQEGGIRFGTKLHVTLPTSCGLTLYID